MGDTIAWKPKSNDANVASVRYRCLIPLEALKQKGMSVELFDEKKVDNYKAVIFSKLYDKKNQDVAYRVHEAGGIVILDLCDNHFYNPFELDAYNHVKINLLKMISIADKIVCSTKTLAEVVKEEAGLDVMPVVIGDPVENIADVDVTGWKKKLSKRLIDLIEFKKRDLPYLLWYGSHGAPNAPSGMEDILKIESVLCEAYEKYPFELVVVSNSKKKFDDKISVLNIPVRYVEWDQNKFNELLVSARAVIIPININPFTVCKTNNRLALALSCKVPVVADLIPSYEEFSDYCYLDNWKYGLEMVLRNDTSVMDKVRAGHKYLKENWMIDNVVSDWELFLKEV